MDLGDERTFAYVLYPRVSTPLGHVPASWAREIAGADYVALWESAKAPPQARAAARAGEASLRRLLPGREACVYGDAQGDRGLIVGTAPEPRGAPVPSREGSAAPDGDLSPWVAYAQTLLGLASLWAIGGAALFVLAGRALTPRLLIAGALLVGCLAVALELLLWSIAGIPWTARWLAPPWCALVAGAIWRGIRSLRAQGTEPAPGATHRHLAADELLALGALAVLATIIVVAAQNNLPQSDGIHFTYFQARAFFLDRSVAPYYAHAREFIFSAPAHPPLVPLSVTWLYLFLGRTDEQRTLLLWPAFWLSLVAAFYAFARVAASRRLALWGTLAFGTIGYPLSNAAIGRAPGVPNGAGYADLPLAVYPLLACGLLWCWATPGCHARALPLAAGAALAAAPLTKEEGLPAALCILIATAVLAATRLHDARSLPRRVSREPVLAAALVFALGALPWAILRPQYAPPEVTAQGHGGLVATLRRLLIGVTALGVRAALARFAPGALIATYAALRRRGPGRWDSWPGARFWLLVAVTLGQLAADGLGLALDSNDIHTIAGWAAPRLVLQLLLLPFLGVLELWPSVLAPRDGIPAKGVALDVSGGAQMPP